jgi:hypothetical protein
MPQFPIPPFVENAGTDNFPVTDPPDITETAGAKNLILPFAPSSSEPVAYVPAANNPFIRRGESPA